MLTLTKKQTSWLTSTSSRRDSTVITTRTPVHDRYDRENEKRHDQTIEWLEQFDLGETFATGAESYLERVLGAKTYEYTDFDDYRVLEKVHTILCFECIEHAMNPLSFLKSFHGKAEQVFLSTPIRSYWWLDSPYHFNIFNRKRLFWLIDKAGFVATHEKVINPNPFTLRPRGFLRWVYFHRVILLRLIPA